MVDSSSTAAAKELRAFRTRLRHDHLLRQRLRRARLEVTVALAQELGFDLTIDHLLSGSAKGKRRAKAGKR